MRRLAWSPIRHARTALLMLAACAACAAPPREATRQELVAWRTAAGQLARAETVTVGPRGRYLKLRITLHGTRGHDARGWALIPRTGGGPFPAVLLADGREEDAGVIERLPAEFGDVVVLSLDYPAAMPFQVRLEDAFLHGERLDSAAREVPIRFLLGVDWLARQSFVDSARIAVTATSFAVPFATIAAAVDPRIHELALIYGAGDLPRVLAANLTITPAVLRLPAARVALRRFAPLAPERFIGHVAPRPVVMVNGAGDPQMPREAVQRLYDAARAPKALIWLRTGHLMPTDSALIRTLVDTAFARLTVLRPAAR